VVIWAVVDVSVGILLLEELELARLHLRQGLGGPEYRFD
jgi:hypothetical protein